MTLRTGEGLEGPVVFLTGLEDGIFPHSRALGDPTELEEERRLAYVGLTRAQQRLYVSRALVPALPARCPAAQSPLSLSHRAADHAARLEAHRGRPDDVVEHVGEHPLADAGGYVSPVRSAMTARRGPLPSPKPTAGSRPVPSLEPGDRVLHDSFGMGTVVTVEGVADKAVASIDFGSTGVKRLLLRYSPVEKL